MSRNFPNELLRMLGQVDEFAEAVSTTTKNTARKLYGTEQYRLVLFENVEDQKMLEKSRLNGQKNP